MFSLTRHRVPSASTRVPQLVCQKSQQSTGQASTQAVSFVPMQGSAITKAMGHLRSLSPLYAQRERRFKREASRLASARDAGRGAFRAP
jgi:hypothetical protein